jgi:hypothetical protein
MIVSHSNILIFLFTPAVAKNSPSRSKLSEHTKLEECKRSPCFKSAFTLSLLKDKYLHKPSRKGFIQALALSLPCSFNAKLLMQLLSVKTTDPLPSFGAIGECLTASLPEE